MIKEEIIKNAGLNENKSSVLKDLILGSGKSQGKNVNTFGIMTSENPNAKEMSKKENKSNRKSLMTDLSGKFNYTAIKGKYDSEENSYVIYNISVTELMKYASKYEQESFIFGRKEDGVVFEFYKRKDSKSPYKKTDSSKEIESVAEAKNYFSSLRDFKFSILFKTLM